MTRLLSFPLRALVEGSLAILARKNERLSRRSAIAPIDCLSAYERRDVGLDPEAAVRESWQRY